MMESLCNTLLQLLRRRSSAALRLVAIFLTLLLGLALPVPARSAEDQVKALRDRAVKLWDARVKADWSTAYEFLSPSEKAKVTKEQYVTTNQQKGPLKYSSYKLGEVHVDGDFGWVHTEYEAVPFVMPQAPPKKIKYWQVWEKVAGTWYPVPKEGRDRAHKLPPKLRPLKDEAALTARVNTFWQAREKEDYRTVYDMCSPAFRQKVSADEFLQAKARNLYLTHKVEFVEVEGDKARAHVTFTFRPNDPNLTKMAPSEESTVQPWIRIDGQWYLDAQSPS